ncbi:MAG: ATP-grasp domain-containing protein [Betaproteobacteria bacterium]|nr:ATP-grasp domain-containing protein [Betaproteobacteria bacterium]
MTRTVLLVATATQWLGTARTPGALARAGFRVALLAPRGSLVLKSRFLSEVGLVSDTAVPMEWLGMLIRLVDKVDPVLLVPCDEMAVRLLFILVLDPPPGLKPELQTRLAALVAKSMGEPRFYAASIDKTLLPPAAEALGVRVPPHAIVDRAHDAVAFAEARGYPVVLKRRFGFSGAGVAIVQGRAELLEAAQQLLRPNQIDLGENRAPRLLVQAFVTGAHHSQALVALQGAPLASFGWARHVATREGVGQTAVLRFVASPETRAFSEKLCRGFGLCGFFNAQFIIDAATGEAHLLEINRRIVTHMHMGERVGADLGLALRRALDGEPPVPPAEPPAAGQDIVVVFPREWLRDPGSRYLAEYPADVPWDEPELFEAMLALRHDE